MKPARNLLILRTIPLMLIMLFFSSFSYCKLIYTNNQSPGIGAMGDSLTNEYSQRAWYYGDSSALNWVDLLATLRDYDSSLPQLTFGDYQTNPDVWGSPRYGGYENNWANAGADTATLLSEGQHTGIANQVRAGQVQYVALFIGSNDFNPYAHDAYSAIYSQTEPFIGTGARQYADANEYVDSIIERYITALDVVSQEGARIVMATIADFGVTPHVVNNFPSAEKRQRVTNVIETVNNRLKALATARSLPIVDIFEMAKLYLGSDPLMVGGIPITIGAPPSANSQYLILPGRIHPGTVLQGLLANTFIEACNLSYGTNFTPLSDQEILASAGINVPEGDVTFFDIRPYIITKYSGGTGEPNDPYQIATAEDLILLGESPEDYDKHFILTDDIDLDPNLPGRKVFDRAVIASDMNDANWWFDGTPFLGIFDGNDHIVSHLTIEGESYLGLFGHLDFGAKIFNLGLEEVDINGNDIVGGLAGSNNGIISISRSTGSVIGESGVGGLIGFINWDGSLSKCYSISTVIGSINVGGLVGVNTGDIIHCYGTGDVSGSEQVGGLVGSNGYDYDPNNTLGTSGGLGVGLPGGGERGGRISNCYSTSSVLGDNSVGGLVGYHIWRGTIVDCFWDIQTSGQESSAGGIGLTTAEMQMASTFIHWRVCSDEPIWTIDEGNDYPRLWWEGKRGEVIKPILSDFLVGSGTKDDPYLIYTPEELNLIGLELCDWDKHFKLMADIDLSGFDGKDGRAKFNIIAPDEDSKVGYQGTPFTGVFDGDGHTISHLTLTGESYVGLFGQLAFGASVVNLGVLDIDITGSGKYVGGLVAYNRGNLTCCNSTGLVNGGRIVGGLVGYGGGPLNQCYSACTVIGSNSVGGLVGIGHHYVTNCFSTGSVSGDSSVGGLVGVNYLKVSRCYSNCSVKGTNHVGGLVGYNGENSAGTVGTVTASFWDL